MGNSESESAAERTAYNKACRLVGQFMNSWAHLESAMNTGIAKILGMDSLEGVIATVNMQARAKIHIVKTLINLRGQPEDWRDAALKTMNRIAAISDHRNVVAHTPFGPHDSGGVEFLSIKAKGKLTFPDTIWPDTEFYDYCNEMSSLSEEVKAITEKLHKHKILLKLADVLSKQKQSPQGALNALFHPAQSLLDSPEANPPEGDQTPVAERGE